MQETQDKVLRYIESKQSQTITFFKELVSFPSVTGNELGIQQFIAKKLESMGLTVDIWVPDKEALRKHPAYVDTTTAYTNRPNVVGIYRGTGGGKSLLLNGHVDVIPPWPDDMGFYGPWAGEIKNGQIYGRGTSDMKSGLAAMTVALESLINQNIKLKGDLFLEYTMDEEATGNGTLACLTRGYKADAGICCETSSLHVQPACIGRIWFEIIVRGKPAGIQRRFEGINAIEKGYAVVQAVANLETIRINEVHHPLYPDNLSTLPCMVGVFQAGTFNSAFPDTCLLKGSLATLPGEDTAQVKQSFRDHILTFAKTDPWLKDHPPEISFVGYCGDPAEIPQDHPIVTTLSQKFKYVTGGNPQITGRQGAADTRYLIKYGSTPTVIFGPGLTEQMHATNEMANIKDLITATKILALTMMEWCGYEN